MSAGFGKKKALLLLLLVCVCLLAAGAALGQADDYALVRSRPGGSGSRLSSGPWTLVSSLRPAGRSALAADGYTLQSGFLAGVPRGPGSVYLPLVTGE